MRERIGIQDKSPVALASSKSGQMIKVFLAYLTCAAIWGTGWYASRVCVGPGGFPTFTAAFLRFAIPAWLMWLFLHKPIWNEAVKARGNLTLIVVGGIFNALGGALVFISLEHIPGGLAAVICATTSLFIAGIAIATRSERISAATLIGAVTAVLGVALVFHDRLQTSVHQASSIIAMLGASMMYACSNVALKRDSAHMSSQLMTFVTFASCSGVLCALAMLFDHPVPPAEIQTGPLLALAYLSIANSLIAFLAYFYLLKHVRLMTIGTLTFVQPIIAIVADAVWDRSVSLNFQSYIGIGIVLLAVILSVLAKGRADA